MPSGDKTGPSGLGHMTGRAAGYCAGYSVPGFMNPIDGYGRGLGGGRGRGGGRRFGRERFVYPQPVAVQPTYRPGYQLLAQPQSPRQEIAILENYQLGLEIQKSDLKQEMDSVKARIEELIAKLDKQTHIKQERELNDQEDK